MLTLNGQVLDLSSAKVTLNGEDASAAAVKAGMEISGSGTLEGGKVKVRDLEVRYRAQGQADQVDLAGKFVVVAGLKAFVTDKTLIFQENADGTETALTLADLAAGDYLKVAGIPRPQDPDDAILATRLERESSDDPNRVELMVPIRKLNPTAQTFTYGLQTYTVDYSKATLRGTLVEGAVVRFRGSKSGTTITALRVRAIEGKEKPDVPDGTRIELRGLVGNLNPTTQTFQVEGLSEAAIPAKSLESSLAAYLRTLSIALPITLLLAVFLTALLLGYLMRPVHHLTKAAHDLAQQRFPEPIPIPSGNDELTQLAQSFNRMSHAVRGFLEREKSFTRYASHELRTPLATLRAQIEAMQQGLVSQAEAMPHLEAGLRRIEDILNGLLTLTRNPEPDPHPLQLHALVESVLAGMPPACQRRIEITLEGATWTVGPRELVAQAIGNLIENACKYSQGPVRVHRDHPRKPLPSGMGRKGVALEERWLPDKP